MPEACPYAWANRIFNAPLLVICEKYCQIADNKKRQILDNTDNDEKDNFSGSDERNHYVDGGTGGGRGKRSNQQASA